MLYKRRGYWHIDVNVDGQRIRRSAGTKDRRRAEEFERRVQEDAWRIIKLKESPRRTWNEAVVRWIREKQHLAGLKEVKRQFRWLDPYLGGKLLDQIDVGLIDRIRAERQGSAGTINKTLQAVRGVLRSAREWGWMKEVPPIRLLPENNKRLRWLSRDEAGKLLSELPDHLAEMARFTLATGLRMSNVTRLEWSQIDLERRCAWIHADQAKARKALSVPLNAEAMLVLRRQEGKHETAVFTYEGEPIRKANGKAWRKACKRAGLSARWHDLRHTWASWHVQAGTPLAVLKELGGWSDFDMVGRYAHLAPEHLAEHAERLSRPKVVTITTPSGKEAAKG